MTAATDPTQSTAATAPPATGLEGVVVAESEISFVDGQAGRLVYRGYAIEDLAAHSTFEETVALLLFGELPTQAELDTLNAALVEARPRSEEHTSELQSQSNLVCRLLLE